jgi:hypothetical protein
MYSISGTAHDVNSPTQSFRNYMKNWPRLLAAV